jgi:hypothetical protein
MPVFGVPPLCAFQEDYAFPISRFAMAPVGFMAAFWRIVYERR